MPSKNHTFNANNMCTVCGYYSKHVINSINDPIAVVYYQQDGYAALSPLEDIFRMLTGKKKIT